MRIDEARKGAYAAPLPNNVTLRDMQAAVEELCRQGAPLTARIAMDYGGVTRERRDGERSVRKPALRAYVGRA